MSTFRLFLIDKDGSRLRRVDPSPENAFAPEPDATNAQVYFASYGARGYDIAVSPLNDAEPAAPFHDAFPAAIDEPPPFDGPTRPYDAASFLRPRFVAPYTEIVSDEWRVGLATASFDPLFRVTYGLAASLGTETTKPNALAYLRYDRFAPTFTALARRESSPTSRGLRRTTEGRFSVDFPLERSVLRSQSLNLTLRRRREAEPGPGSSLDTGTLAASWLLDSTKNYPMAISPMDGLRMRAAVTRDLKALGSDLDFGKIIVDARAYLRLGKTVAAVRLGGARTYGQHAPRNAFTVGGLASPALLDPVGDEPAVLRGYEAADPKDASRFGRRLAFGNVDWRIPLAHPARGVRAFPFFLRHLHATASVDAAVISEQSFHLNAARVGLSFGLGADMFVGHRIPLTVQGGVGRGLTRDGATVPWFSIGFPF